MHKLDCNNLVVGPKDLENENWVLRIKPLNLDELISKQKYRLLFFDGASKNNRGLAGVGGFFVFDPEGIRRQSYSWGIGGDYNQSNKTIDPLARVKVSYKKNNKSIDHSMRLYDSFELFYIETNSKRGSYIYLFREFLSN